MKELRQKGSAYISGTSALKQDVQASRLGGNAQGHIVAFPGQRVPTRSVRSANNRTQGAFVCAQDKLNKRWTGTLEGKAFGSISFASCAFAATLYSLVALCSLFIAL